MITIACWFQSVKNIEPTGTFQCHDLCQDSLISKLIGACQMNDISRAFVIYERLRHMQVPLYEGVYKMIIECCMRTQQLGHAMHFYETLKGPALSQKPL